MKESWWMGLLQALGLGLYILAVAGFMQNAESWIGNIDQFIGPVLFLTLFAFSALVCGLITFYYPVKLFMDKKPKKAVQVVFYTAVFLFLFLVGVLVFATGG